VYYISLEYKKKEKMREKNKEYSIPPLNLSYPPEAPAASIEYVPVAGTFHN